MKSYSPNWMQEEWFRIIAPFNNSVSAEAEDATTTCANTAISPDTACLLSLFLLPTPSSSPEDSDELKEALVTPTEVNLPLLPHPTSTLLPTAGFERRPRQQFTDIEVQESRPISSTTIQVNPLSFKVSVTC